MTRDYFVKKFTKLQQKLNISDAGLANELRVARSSVVKWKQGKNLPFGSYMRCRIIEFLEDKLGD